jgi:hypothetical protein
MAKPRPEKKPKQKANEQLPLPTSRPSAPSPSRVLPMQLTAGDRLANENGEYEVIGRPYTTNTGKDVHVRVKRVDDAAVTVIRTRAAPERIAVRRESAVISRRRRRP